MKDYLLFIDTEASSLPKKWDLPYSAEDNWPNCVQVSWVIYTKEGQEVKQEDHYINDNDFEISKSSAEIHGITREFLVANGESRKEVFTILAGDYETYDPIVIGHFMEFDGHMIGADFYRAGIENPVKRSDTFCTMLATSHLMPNPSLKYFRLGDLYNYLFNITLQDQHNALVDAKATAECFFELLKRGEITEEKIDLQQKQLIAKQKVTPASGCVLPILFAIFLTLLIYYYL